MIKKIFLKFRKAVFRNYRERVLSKTICKEIENLEEIKKRKVIKILDYGSGHNPVVINNIISNLNNRYKKTKFRAYCYDFYKKNELKKMNNNADIKFANIKNLSYSKIRKFNFCLLIDVLHHIDLKNSKKVSKIIKNLKKISKFLIIKDHFQYGIFSTLALIIMDFVGNYGDSVKIPRIYFSKETFETLLKNLKLKEIKRINNKKYYKWYWFYFNKKNLQFLSILK